jgi:hypothetical protein
MWWIMILGGIITISFSFLFGTVNKIPYALMVASLSCIITLLLLLIYALDQLSLLRNGIDSLVPSTWSFNFHPIQSYTE